MMYDVEASMSGVHGTDSDNDDPTTLQNGDLDSSDDDDDDEYECEQKAVKTRELEWDDSTLSY